MARPVVALNRALDDREVLVAPSRPTTLNRPLRPFLNAQQHPPVPDLLLPLEIENYHPARCDPVMAV